jgi:glycerol kinase
MPIPCVVSIDQGTSSSRVIIFDSHGQVLGSKQVEHQQHYPQPGFVEHDPLEIWSNVRLCLIGALKEVKSDVQISCIGITNQRETTVVWNKSTGLPYHKAIVWNDTRTSAQSKALIERFKDKDFFREKTGLPIASYFSATKILYLMESVPNLKAEIAAGNAIVGTIDSWLMWRLTGGQTHNTDVTNASRTLLMNLQSLDWDEGILSTLNIPRSILPTVRPSSHHFGVVEVNNPNHLQADADLSAEDQKLLLRFQGVPITGVVGDQNAALFGQTCFQRGETKCTYGTGAFMLMNTGHDIIQSKNGLLTTLAYQLGPKPVYALEGSVAYSGSLIQWLRDNLQVISKASETEAIAASVKDNGGVFFVPAFAGLYAPYWREDARAVIAGLTAYNTKAHIVRAALESSAFQVKEVADAMVEDIGGKTKLETLKVDGGFTANSLIMQFQSDILNIPLLRPKIAETTCLGAAFVAGLGSGVWKNLDEVKSVWKEDKQWRPAMQPAERAKLLHYWEKTVARSLHWHDNASFDANGKVASANSDPFVSFLSRGSAARVATVSKVAENVQKQAARRYPPSALFATGFLCGGLCMLGGAYF